MFYLLEGRLCGAIALDPFDVNGRPQRLVYWYKSTEGLGAVETRTTNNVGWVEDGDDGSSWTAATAPRGAMLAVEVHGHVNLGALYSRLVALHARREEVIGAEQGGATHGEGTPPEPVVADDRPTWQRLGYESKVAWRAAGSPQ